MTARTIAPNSDVYHGARTGPTMGLITLIAKDQIARNIDPDEALRYFSWTLFALIAVVYTVFVFWVELAKDGPFILSPRNTRTMLQVFFAHALFLMILLCCYQICVYVVPTLPFWMTDTFRLRHSSRASIIDICSLSARLPWLTLSASGCTRSERRRRFEQLADNTRWQLLSDKQANLPATRPCTVKDLNAPSFDSDVPAPHPSPVPTLHPL